MAPPAFCDVVLKQVAEQEPSFVIAVGLSNSVSTAML